MCHHLLVLRNLGGTTPSVAVSIPAAWTILEKGRVSRVNECASRRILSFQTSIIDAVLLGDDQDQKWT